MTKLGCQSLEVTKLIVLLASLLLNRVHLRLQEVELTFEVVHWIIVLCLHEILQLADLALPNVLLTCNHLLLHSDDVLAVFEFFLKVQYPDEICNHSDFLLCRSLNFEFLNTVKGVTHNRNEQVHENQLDNERAKDEEEPNQWSIHCSKVVHIELTEPHKVGAHEAINPRYTEYRWDNLILNALQSPVLIEDQHRVAESSNADKEECKEGDDVYEDLVKHPDKGSRRVE